MDSHLSATRSGTASHGHLETCCVGVKGAVSLEAAMHGLVILPSKEGTCKSGSSLQLCGVI